MHVETHQGSFNYVKHIHGKSFNYYTDFGVKEITYFLEGGMLMASLNSVAFQALWKIETSAYDVSQATNFPKWLWSVVYFTLVYTIYTL